MRRVSANKNFLSSRLNSESVTVVQNVDFKQSDVKRFTLFYFKINKKLSYRRETARQLPTWREGG